MEPIDPAVQALVPHRPPILRLDRIAAVTAAPRATAFGHEPLVAGGGLPWELGLIEGLAQTAATMRSARDVAATAEPGRLVGLRRFTFHRAPAPGAEIRYEVEMVRRLGPIGLVRGAAHAGGLLLAEGELKLWCPGSGTGG